MNLIEVIAKYSMCKIYMCLQEGVRRLVEVEVDGMKDVNVSAAAHVRVKDLRTILLGEELNDEVRNRKFSFNCD